jgi:hypothetical protein
MTHLPKSHVMIRRLTPSIETLLHRSTYAPGKVGHVDISGGFLIAVGEVHNPHGLHRNGKYRRCPLALQLDSKDCGWDKGR